MTRNDQPVFYREADADPSALAGQTVAVLGYGNLGRSVACNLRDAGVAVVVGNRDDEHAARARADGFTVTGVAEAAATGDVVWLLVPDEVMGTVFADAAGPRLRPGAAVCVSSGYALAYGLVTAPDGVDVLLLAPRMLGQEVRRAYLEGGGFVSYVSVEQDATGKARGRLLALAQAIGALRRGALELPAAQEAALDLFVEQSVGPYLGTAFLVAFQIGLEAGLPPEALVLEMYMSGEMSRTLTTFAEEGFLASVHGHGLTAAYGGFLRSLTLDRERMEQGFREILADITSGGFARTFQSEQAAGYPSLRAIREMTGGDNPITAAEQTVRAALDQDPATGDP